MPMDVWLMDIGAQFTGRAKAAMDAPEGVFYQEYGSIGATYGSAYFCWPL
jgi:hypothetical protein